MDADQIRDKAWIGDAVLALFARKWLLSHPLDKRISRHDAFELMTSNASMSALGEPTAVEAKIGVIYEEQGLDAAFEHIESTILPQFERRVRKRLAGR